MKDEQLQQTVSSWLIDDDITPPDSLQSARQVAARLPKVQQQGRWWPLPLLRRSPAPPRTIPDTESQSTPIPAANGHTPTVLGRTHSMFSPVKAITAGALVFALGGVLLIAQPFSQQAEVAPGAEAEFSAPVEVTGRFSSVRGTTLAENGDAATLPGVHYLWGYDGGSVTASDPRLEGTVSLRSDERELVGNGLDTSERLAAACETHPECDGGVMLGLQVRAWSIENDEGVWRQRPEAYIYFPGIDDSWGKADPVVQVFDGEGGYEGLVAVIAMEPPLDALWPDDNSIGATDAFFGFILDERMLPEVPANALRD